MDYITHIPVDTRGIAFIYALTHPDNDEPKYIGQSVAPFERLRQHLRDRQNSPKKQWIDLLKLDGKTPTIRIVEIVNRDEAYTKEESWITKLASSGHELVNSTHCSEVKPALRTNRKLLENPFGLPDFTGKPGRRKQGNVKATMWEISYSLDGWPFSSRSSLKKVALPEGAVHISTTPIQYQGYVWVDDKKKYATGKSIEEVVNRLKNL